MGIRTSDRIVKRAKQPEKVVQLHEAEALKQAHKRLGIQPKNIGFRRRKQLS